jgi:hypothetical protein
MKNKIFIVGLISLMMVAGFVALSCKDKACCTASDWGKWMAQIEAGTVPTGIPACCADKGTDCCDDAIIAWAATQ